MDRDKLTTRKAEVEALLTKRLQQRQQVQDAMGNLEREIVGLQAILSELTQWLDEAPPEETPSHD